MFNKNTYMIPHQGTSPSTSVLDLNGNEILLHHHGHHDMFSGHYLATTGPSVEAAAALFNQDINGGGLSGEHSGTLNTCPRTPKRDRHSKIDTAQGPRDRRVRLSIGVARKFFDLQEMLGFDKPSKTLDWLLTKSKTAIKDLAHTTKQSSTGVVSSPPPTSDECEVENDEKALYEKGKSVIKNTSIITKGAAVKDLMAKESRVKARARARERTREKMCIKQLNESRNAGYCDLISPSNNNNCNNIPIQYMNNQLDQFCRISGSNNVRLLSGINYGTNYGECDDQESVNVTKRKVKHHPSLLGFHQPNLILPGSNYGVVPFSGNYNNANDQNWDHISGFSSSQSNLSAILDQHKFNNR